MKTPFYFLGIFFGTLLMIQLHLMACIAIAILDLILPTFIVVFLLLLFSFFILKAHIKTNSKFSTIWLDTSLHGVIEKELEEKYKKNSFLNQPVFLGMFWRIKNEYHTLWYE